jgi:hypothetical protein
MEPAETALPVPSTSTTDQRRRISIKGQCEQCEHYHACPRMRGENICYGKHEVIWEEFPSATAETLNSAQEA